MAETYTMKLVVDDSAVRKLEERLGKLMGGSGGGGGSSGGGGGIFGGADSPFKQLLKLGVIAAGVSALVVAVKKITEKVVDASPALQAMFKILDAAVTLILRPFGDFIAYLLKPILIIFLTKVALPFYKMFQPLMAFLGGTIGEGIASVATGVGQIITGFLEGDMEKITNGFNVFKGIWLNFVDWLSDALGLSPELQKILNGFFDWFRNLIIQPWVVEIIGNFFEFIKDLIVNPDIRGILDRFFGWFANLDVGKLFSAVLPILFGFAGWFFNLLIDPRVTELVKSFLAWFINLDIPGIITELVLFFFKWFENLEIKDWVNVFLSSFFLFFWGLQIVQTLFDPFISFVNFIIWIAKQIKRAADWFSSALDAIGLGGLFGGGGGGNNTTTNNNVSPTLNINIEGGGTGSSAEMKDTIMSWFNEWMK